MYILHFHIISNIRRSVLLTFEQWQDTPEPDFHKVTSSILPYHPLQNQSEPNRSLFWIIPTGFLGGVVCWFSPVFGILYQKILSNLRYCIIVVLWRFCIIVNVFRCVLLFCCLNWWHWFMFVFVIGSHFSCHNNWSFDFASVQHISFRLLNLNTVVLLHLRASYLSFLQISQAWEMGSWTWHYHVCNGLVTRVLWCSLGNKGMMQE